jgi:hypothetical protein
MDPGSALCGDWGPFAFVRGQRVARATSGIDTRRSFISVATGHARACGEPTAGVQYDVGALISMYDIT